MKPKEKAEELVLKYLRIDNNTKEWFNSYIAKKCALIAVDEILDNMMLYKENFNDGRPIHHKSYWQEVKQEIEKL
jgi:hypothetical protein